MLLLDCDAALLPGQVVDLSVSYDLQQALLEIELEMPDDGTMPSDVQERIENRPVWQLLRSLARVLWIRVSARSLRICCGLQKTDDSLGARALRLFEDEDPLARSENEVLSRLFHDLKNHLIAYQMALGGGGRGQDGAVEK